MPPRHPGPSTEKERDCQIGLMNEEYLNVETVGMRIFASNYNPLFPFM